MSAQASKDADYDFSMLDDEGLKARLLLKIVGTLNAVAEQSYKEERPLNTLVMFDEAHRYAPPIRGEMPEEVRELSSALARYARETRKYGVGWTYITLTIGTINHAIFDMLGVRACGYGLGSSDLRAMEEHIDSRESLDLYRTFANPEQTERYPFMVAGPFSPLSFTKAPLFVTAFEPEEWVKANAHWITERARQHRVRGVRLPVTLDALRRLSQGQARAHGGRPAPAPRATERADAPPVVDSAGEQPIAPPIRSSLRLPLDGVIDGDGGRE
jgi:hypothetical protein